FLTALVSTASANDTSSYIDPVLDNLTDHVVHSIIETQKEKAHVLNLIDWKVGDSMNYQIKGMLGDMGTMVKSADREEGNGLWVKVDMSLMGQKELIETLYDRATAQVLKMKRNGKDMEI